MSGDPIVFPSKKIIVAFDYMSGAPGSAYKILSNKLEAIKVPENFSLPKEKPTDKELAKIKKDQEEKKEAVAKLVSNKKVIMEILENASQYNNIIEYASENLRNDKEVMMKVILLNVFSAGDASDKLKDDKEFALNLIKKIDYKYHDSSGYSSISYIFSILSERLKGDDEVAMLAATRDLRILEYTKLKDDKKFVLNLIKKIDQDDSIGGYSNVNYIFFKNLSEKLKNDDEVAMLAATRDPKILEYTDKKDDLNFILKLIYQKKTYDSSLINQFISNKLQYDPKVLNAIKENTMQSNKTNK